MSLWFSVGVAVRVESGDTLADGVLFSSGVSENFSNSREPKIIDQLTIMYTFEQVQYELAIQQV